MGDGPILLRAAASWGRGEERRGVGPSLEDCYGDWGRPFETGGIRYRPPMPLAEGNAEPHRGTPQGISERSKEYGIPRPLIRFWRVLLRITRLTIKIWRHPANSGHRVKAFARVAGVYFSALVLRSRRQVPIGDHSRIWADRRFVNSIEVAIGNPPEWKEMQAWKKILGKDTLFVDIGANVGTYSMWAADLGSEVIAVEPMADALKALDDNAALNGYGLEIVPAALAEDPGVMRMTNWLATRNHLLPEAETEGVEVEVRTLDSVLGDRIAHGVKIDVEGAERLVLEGATTALAEGRLLVIQVEWNVLAEELFGERRSRLAEMLRGYGYEFYRPDEQGQFQLAGTEVSTRDLFAIICH